ncbi:Carbonic anhydrase-related protein 10 [Nymphon striatum]|nr:Carbonic anhydrase-related protein 10 [Nymphon striatum]
MDGSLNPTKQNRFLGSSCPDLGHGDECIVFFISRLLLYSSAIGELSNPELRLLTTHLDKIRYKGQSHPVRHISIHTLLPETDDFMTYDGSTTSPGCYETVSWIIMNKPIYITRQQLHSLRKLMVGTRVHQKAPLGDNYRPPMPVNHRTIRTNIDFSKNKDNVCPTMKSKRLYKGEFDKQTN